MYLHYVSQLEIGEETIAFNVHPVTICLVYCLHSILNRKMVSVQT